MFTEPEPIGSAWSQVESWLGRARLEARAHHPPPTTRHRELFGACLGSPGLHANDVPDAHLAALAIEHGLQLATSDAGFARFDGLRWFDPLKHGSGGARPR